MRKLFILGAAIVVSVAMLMTACKKDEVNNRSVTPNQVYPSTAVVLPQAVTDIDGNSYDAVQIGNQVWMAENLRTTKYADGTTIPMGQYSYGRPYRYAPGPNQSNEDNMANVARYGYLYNYLAVMHASEMKDGKSDPNGVQGICPDGWHVPSDAEWIQLTNYMKTQSIYMANGDADHLAKALASTWGWRSCSYEEDAIGNNPSTNNATGFSALPAGSYEYGSYESYGSVAYFWSATQYDDNLAYLHSLCFNMPDVYRDYHGLDVGFSVRCVRD
ncbi:MAG: fibrobacter succinogenes major paralogous domain-containing protein [Bacteroidales bacterium]|nr:fibrobacter succinogenes major paralogous domain-containing protein [Bacteroidales bacterium]